MPIYPESTDICQCIEQYSFTWSEAGRMWPFYGWVMTPTLIVPSVETKERAQTLVWRTITALTVSFPVFSLLTNDLNFQLQATSLKKEKRESKKDISATPRKDYVDSLNHSASVLVIGAVDGQRTLQSPGFSGPAAEKKQKV